MRKGLVALAATAVLLAACAACAGVARAAGSGGTCGVKAGVSLTPGISLTKSKGTFAGKPGATLACTGQINGKNVAGQAKSFAFSGSYGTKGGDDCSQGAGSGKLSAALPTTTGGTVKLAGTFTFTRVGSDVVLQGKLGALTIAGNLQFLPDPGQTCASTKVTSATVAGGAAIAG